MKNTQNKSPPDNARAAGYLDEIINGDCRDVLKTLPAGSVDLVLTDPPYGVSYRDRGGRTIANDTDLGPVVAAFRDIYRVLKWDRLCVSFYGWNRPEILQGWIAAGFTPVEHVVWRKSYASSERFMKRQHEQAYVLAKGRPPVPDRPPADIREWKYSGNRVHPTEKHVDILTPLIESFCPPGGLVLDPFAGSGSTCVAAAITGRRYCGIELEARYCEHACERLDVAERDRRQAA
jgi:site-specific DNA-methyltransferase (adenine-specific)